MTLNDLKKSPPLLIAICVIAAATFLIIYFNPMHSVCDIQLQSLKVGMQGYMFSYTTKDRQGNEQRVPAIFSEARKKCRQGNSSGACDDYFSVQKQLMQQFDKINSECIPTIQAESSYHDVLAGGLQLLATAAWGDKIPDSAEERNGWLGERELALFCDMKKTYLKFYGRERLTEIENRSFKDLPGESVVDPNVPTGAAVRIISVAEKMKQMGVSNVRVEVLKRSLFGLDCRFY